MYVRSRRVPLNYKFYLPRVWSAGAISMGNCSNPLRAISGRNLVSNWFLKLVSFHRSCHPSPPLLSLLYRTLSYPTTRSNITRVIARNESRSFDLRFDCSRTGCHPRYSTWWRMTRPGAWASTARRKVSISPLLAKLATRWNAVYLRAKYQIRGGLNSPTRIRTPPILLRSLPLALCNKRSFASLALYTFLTVYMCVESTWTIWLA